MKLSYQRTVTITKNMHCIIELLSNNKKSVKNSTKIHETKRTYRRVIKEFVEIVRIIENY